MKYVALLRGINVGGSRVIKMKDLQAAVVELGFPDAVTHIQSGNVIFTAPDGQSAAANTKTLETGLEKAFGFSMQVILRSGAELDEIVETCPFAGVDAEDGVKRYITFLAEAPGVELAEFIGTLQSEQESNVVKGREIYHTHSTGVKDALFAKKLTERKMKMPFTNRNWGVTLKLAELSRE